MRPHPRDRERLAWMRRFEEFTGRPPTAREIRTYEGWSSDGSARLFVRRMQHEGFLDAEGRVVEGSLA